MRGEPSPSWPSEHDGRTRSTLRLLVDRCVGAYFAAKTLGSVGVWIHNVVAAIVVYEVSGSALLVGLVSIVQFTPQIFLAPWMGAVADRRSHRQLIIAGKLVGGSSAAAVAVWTTVGTLEGPVASVPYIIAALLVGIGFAMAAPAMQAIVPALARPSELPAVIAILQSPFTIARAGGPALGAFLLVTAGPPAAFGFVAAAQLAFVLIVWRLPLRYVAPRDPTDGSGSVRAGLRYVRDNVRVLLLLLGVAAVGFGVDPVITLTPPLTAELGGDAELVGWMASAFGLGAGAALPLLGVLRRLFGLPRMGRWGLWLLAASMAALGLSPVPLAALVSLFVGGIGMMAAITGLTTQIHQQIADEFRGRVMALWSVCFAGSRPLAAALNGSVAHFLSARVALGLCAVLLVLSAVLVQSRKPAD